MALLGEEVVEEWLNRQGYEVLSNVVDWRLEESIKKEYPFK